MRPVTLSVRIRCWPEEEGRVPGRSCGKADCPQRTHLGFNEAAARMPRKLAFVSCCAQQQLWRGFRAVASSARQSPSDAGRVPYSIVKERRESSQLYRFERVPAIPQHRAARLGPATRSPNRAQTQLYHDSAALDRGKALADALHRQSGSIRRPHVDQQHVVVARLHQFP